MAIRIESLTMRFTGTERPALDDLSATIEAGRITGLVGPDGAGKTTLMRLMAGLLAPTEGRIAVEDADTVRDADRLHEIAGYMPQRFGLYEDLSVLQNLRLHARLRGIVGRDRDEAFDRLLRFTGLGPFTGRLAGALSGGMKQKLGLACALIGRPRLLLLDEPSVGVDPISRRELWEMVDGLVREGIGVVWSTAYLDEAERCERVLVLNEGRLMFDGPPGDLTARAEGRSWLIEGTGEARRRVLAAALDRDDVVDGVIQGSAVRLVFRDRERIPEAGALGLDHARLVAAEPRFEDAFVDSLGGGPGGKSALAERMAPRPVATEAVIEAHALTKRFGAFTAASEISFSVPQGRIFGLLGPNGAGKSTTFKMLCGLLVPTSGRALVTGLDLRRAASLARSHIGYMAQKFSLYGVLSVAQNLELFAGLYGLGGARLRQTVEAMVETFELAPYLGETTDQLPLGFKQRLALACAVMHEPAVLFLDEPTSGVDPITRREFWTHINGLVEKGVTVMVTTHFMDEAEYCDSVALIFQGTKIAEGSPDELKASAASDGLESPTMEDAFIALVERSEAARPAERAA